jgi:hypothetical protein
MAMLLFRSGSGVCRSIVPFTAKSIVHRSFWLPASAVRIAARKVPGPASASELTVRPICAGNQRSSSGSSRGRKRVGGRRSARGFDPQFSDRFGNTKESHMISVLSGVGLRFDSTAVGAQTERRGLSWAGEGSAWRPELTGRIRRAGQS